MLRQSRPERDLHLEPIENPGQVSGFSSPAQDYKEDRLHIIQRLVSDPTNTFYFEADNDELINFGIKRGAVLVVDKSLPITSGRIVLVFHEGEWIARQLIDIDGKTQLVTGNSISKILEMNETTDIFGVVTWSCNPLSRNFICLH